MSAVRQWLRRREPAPPPALLDRLLDAVGDDDRPLHLALTRAAVRRLEPGLASRRDRGAGFELLVADALLTYATEAAAEQPSIETALAEIRAELEPAVRSLASAPASRVTADDPT